jgi:hypothetical protein
MTKYERIGAHREIPHHHDPSWSERRGAVEIEEEIWEHQAEFFRFGHVLVDLATQFADERLTVIDGGCGVGNTLREINLAANRLGVAISTVGIEQNQKLFPDQNQVEGVDTVLLGSVQDVHKNGHLPPQSAHFIVDVRGAAFHDHIRSSRDEPTRGATVLPIYSQALKPGGKLLLFEAAFYPGYRGREFLSLGTRENHRLLTHLEKHNLTMERDMRPYALLSKGR